MEYGTIVAVDAEMGVGYVRSDSERVSGISQRFVGNEIFRRLKVGQRVTYKVTDRNTVEAGTLSIIKEPNIP